MPDDIRSAKAGLALRQGLGQQEIVSPPSGINWVQGKEKHQTKLS